MGNGAGLSPYVIGQRAGTENTTLTTSNLPAHTHPFAVKAYSEAGNVSDPTNASPANTGSLDSEYRTSGTAVNMASQTTGVSGSSQPSSLLEPYLVINYSICLEGIYPSRS